MERAFYWWKTRERISRVPISQTLQTSHPCEMRTHTHKREAISQVLCRPTRRSILMAMKNRKSRRVFFTPDPPLLLLSRRHLYIVDASETGCYRNPCSHWISIISISVEFQLRLLSNPFYPEDIQCSRMKFGYPPCRDLFVFPGIAVCIRVCSTIG